jgi:hypothetical protein
MLDDLRITSISCGNRVTFISIYEDSLPLPSESKLTTSLSGSWANYNLVHCIGKYGLLKKRGYLHLFKDVVSTSRNIAVD